ncbi:MAG: Gfo/Idh/MocA family oxidoreductase [Anaerolineales bacterium]
MPQPLKAALVGCGSLSQRGILPHLSQADAREQVVLEAVVDAVEERAAATASRFNVPRSFTTVEAMLSGAEVDLVLVATPIPAHFSGALAAIQAGKHVYVQKAMTSTLAEANALLAARDRAGVKLVAAPGFVLFPSAGEMRALVNSGVLGQVHIAYTYALGFAHVHETIRSGSGTLAEIDPSWYYRAGGGPLPDVGVYSLQLITSVLGPVRRVTAFANQGSAERTWKGKTIPVTINDNNLVMLEFVSGALGVAPGSDCRGSARIPWGGMGLYGTQGALEITEVDMASGYPTKFEVQGGAWPASQAGANPREFSFALTASPYLTGEHLNIEEPHVYCDIMELVDAIQQHRPPRASGEQARHVVEIIEKAYLAAETGQAQTIETSFDPAA